MGMVGAPVKSPSCGARQLEVKDSARSGLLARTCGLPIPKVITASYSSNDGGGDKDDMEGCRL
eukprot:4288547-Pleurochrysis_carterae.AAC.2